MAPRYRVTLKNEERKMLEQISTTGMKAAKTILHARALLLLDAGEHGPKWKVSDVADAVGMTSRSLVSRNVLSNTDWKVRSRGKRGRLHRVP